MKQYVEVEPICPLIGSECVSDGWKHWNQKVVRPCMLWDVTTYNGMIPDEPCRLKRAINRILSDEKPDQINNSPVEVPWDTKEE